MSDEIAKLKAELHALNCHIQTVTNDANRALLQRSRLEAERAQLLVKIMEQVAPTALVAMRSPAYAISFARPAAAPTSPAQPKPAAFPPITQMIKAALQTAAAGLKSGDMVALVRNQRPSATPATIRSTMWGMKQRGVLEKDGELYKLNGHGR